MAVPHAVVGGDSMSLLALTHFGWALLKGTGERALSPEPLLKRLQQATVILWIAAISALAALALFVSRSRAHHVSSLKQLLTAKTIPSFGGPGITNRWRTWRHYYRQQSGRR
jgi:hypothetical protein